jgi:hypothetical protein
MNIYKIIFVKGVVMSCELLPKQVAFKDEYYYELNKGQLIYALIKAPSGAAALEVAERIIKEVNVKTFGEDYIFSKEEFKKIG